MFDIRLRLMNDDGSKGRVLSTMSQDTTLTDSVASQTRFTVSERVAGRLAEPFLVSPEYSTGGAYVAPRHGLLIASRSSADAMDPPKSVAFTAVGFLPWLMARMYVQGTATSGMQRTWPDATPGALALAVINEAKAWGWGPQVTTDFTATHDSNGVAWATGDQSSIQWRVGTSMNQVLEKLADQGKAEWWTEGATLRMFRPGTGADLSGSVVLGGPAFSGAPGQSSFDEVFTRLTVFFDDDQFVNLTNPGASTRFGALWSTMSQNGVKTAAEATALAQPAMTLGRALAEELSFDWTPDAGGPVPFVDFQIGDVVMARTRDGKAPQRVIGLVLSKSSGPTTVRAFVGSKLLGLTAKLAKKVGAATVGQIVAGNGAPMPSAPGPTGVTPQAPSGLHVVSNTAEWRADGSAVATVVLGWDEVTLATDFSPVDVAEYTVWGRRGSEVLAVAATTAGLEVTIDSWEPGTPRYVAVSARGFSGKNSELSDEISVTPASPVSIVPKAPTGLAVTSNTGAFRADGSAWSTVALKWDAVTQSTDGDPASIATYEMWEGSTTDPGVTLLATGTTSASAQWPSGGNRYVRVRAQSDLGVWSDFSGPLQVTPASPSALAGVPTVPVLSTGRGTVVGVWDGKLTTGTPGSGFQHAVVESTISTTPPTGSTVWVRRSQPVTREAGGFILSGNMGQTVWVRLRAVDTLGRIGSPSAVASIVIVGITGPDVEVNSLKGNVIEVGSLTADRVDATFGQSLELGSNSSVTTIINSLSETQNHVDQVAQAADDAAQAAAGAQAGVDDVQGQVETLEGQQSATAGQVAAISTWFRVDAQGAHVGRSDSAFQAHVKPGRFEITENAVVTSYWEGGRMVVPSLETTEIVLARHKFEPYGDGTVVRAIGESV